MVKTHRKRTEVFTWGDGTWISIRQNGIIYYSKDTRETILDENISCVTYNIDIEKNILSIIPHKKKPQNKNTYSLTYHNNGARTFIKKELVRNDYELPEKSIRFFANIDNKKINIDISKLKLSN